MLSIFLRAGECRAEEPANQNAMGDGDGAPLDIKPGVAGDDDSPDLETAEVLGVCDGLLSRIVASAEYLELVYGSMLPVQNILDAAGRLKTVLQKRPRR